MDALLDEVAFVSYGQDLKPDDTPDSLGWPAQDECIVIDVSVAGSQVRASIANIPSTPGSPSHSFEHSRFPWYSMVLVTE